MAKFLTIPRLEELYNSKQGPANTLGYIVRDVRPHMPHNYAYTLVDIGLVMNKLMGGAYRCSYTRRKFRAIYTTLMHKKAPVHHGGSFSSAALARVYSSHLLRNGFNNQSMTADGDTAGHNPELSGNLFAQPFNELLVWSVLTKRQAMAKLMWHHGEEALAKALVASKLYRAMASEAADDDLEVGVYEELRRYSAEFDREALDLLDYCYRQDDDLAQQLLTCELSNWSRQTCLRLAVACHHRQLLSHPCAQLILGDLWLGGLRTRKSSNVQVVLGLICPPWILRLDFKTKKELQLMPQTEEEHMIDLKVLYLSFIFIHSFSFIQNLFRVSETSIPAAIIPLLRLLHHRLRVLLDPKEASVIDGLVSFRTLSRSDQGSSRTLLPFQMLLVGEEQSGRKLTERLIRAKTTLSMVILRIWILNKGVGCDNFG